MTQDSAVRRAGAVAGIVFAVIGIVSGAIVPPPPHPDATAAKVHAYVDAHHAALGVFNVLTLIAPLVLLVFFVGTYRRFGKQEIGVAFLGFGALTVAVALFGALVLTVLVHGSAHLGDDTTVLLFRLGNALFYGGPAIASAGYFAVAAIGVTGDSDLPRWLGPTALVVGAVGLVSGILTVTTASGGPAALGLPGFLLNLAWIAAVSVTALRTAPAVGVVPAAVRL